MPGVGPIVPAQNEKPQSASQVEIKVRRDFSETFLWQDVEIKTADKKRQGTSERGKEFISFKVPDSITSYLISGISMSYSYGIGIPSTHPSLTVFQPFFIQLTLPFSIKRGEILTQNIFIFNFLENLQTVTVSIKRIDSEIEIVGPEFDGWNSKIKIFLINFIIKFCL